MNNLIEKMKSVMTAVFDDIDKGTKASEARVRKSTLALAALGKTYRKESIASRK